MRGHRVPPGPFPKNPPPVSIVTSFRRKRILFPCGRKALVERTRALPSMCEQFCSLTSQGESVWRRDSLFLRPKPEPRKLRFMRSALCAVPLAGYQACLPSCASAAKISSGPGINRPSESAHERSDTKRSGSYTAQLACLRAAHDASLRTWCGRPVRRGSPGSASQEGIEG